jgi:hypothetical protein
MLVLVFQVSIWNNMVLKMFFMYQALIFLYFNRSRTSRGRLRNLIFAQIHWARIKTIADTGSSDGREGSLLKALIANNGATTALKRR